MDETLIDSRHGATESITMQILQLINIKKNRRHKNPTDKLLIYFINSDGATKIKIFYELENQI